ncbi:MAG TPA: SRPBCC family protein [Thermomicrobiales bacterium]|jgi:uncharacterized membrane protein
MEGTDTTQANTRAGVALALAGGAIGIAAYGVYRRTQGLQGHNDDASVKHGEGQKSVNVVTINKPADELYRFWHNFANLPQFMHHLEAVNELGGGRSHWQAKAPLGQSVAWDAQIINDVENELIAWQSIEGAQIGNAGSVRFTPAPFGRGTEVRVTLSYAPPAGKAGVAIAKLLGEEPGRQVADDLRRFKQLMEAGELPTNDRQPTGPGGGLPTLTGAISEATSEPK